MPKKAKKIKLVSGWSHHGGSTVAFVRLCNALNSAGYDCTFYGPHEWHLHQCQAAKIDEFVPEPDDTVLFHFLDVKERIPFVKAQYLVLHEKSGYPVGDRYKNHDKVIFLHEPHREWHGTPKENSLIIPNFFEEFDRKDPGKSRGDIAGIVGSIEKRKNTHISIKRALENGHKKIYLFGGIMDKDYYTRAVQPYMEENPNTIVYKGFSESKQAMYDSVDIVYHWAIEEIACFVLGECKLQGIPCDFGGGTVDYEVYPNEEVLEMWKEVLG